MILNDLIVSDHPSPRIYENAISVLVDVDVIVAVGDGVG